MVEESPVAVVNNGGDNDIDEDASALKMYVNCQLASNTNGAKAKSINSFSRRTSRTKKFCQESQRFLVEAFLSLIILARHSF